MFYKTPDLSNKTVAVPISSAVIGVTTTGQSVISAPFLEALKEQFRRFGWRLIVQGVTGRAGETQSINSGAVYTLVCAEGARELLSELPVNYVLVENKTGEEVMTYRGVVGDVNKAAYAVVQAIEERAKTK